MTERYKFTKLHRFRVRHTLYPYLFLIDICPFFSSSCKKTHDAGDTRIFHEKSRHEMSVVGVKESQISDNSLSHGQHESAVIFLRKGSFAHFNRVKPKFMKYKADYITV